MAESRSVHDLRHVWLVVVVVLMLGANAFLVYQKRQLEMEIDRQENRIADLQRQLAGEGPAEASPRQAPPDEEEDP